MVKQNNTHKAAEEKVIDSIVGNENFGELFEQYIASEEKQEGTIVSGAVIAIDHDSVYIDAGLKSEGRVPKKEFTADELASLDVGSEVEVFLEKYEARGGRTLLSRERALKERSWEQLESTYAKEETVEGMIVGRVKGGFAVDLNGIIAFLPGSQVDVRPIKDISPLLEIAQPFKILKMDEAQGNIVVSRKAILEESRAGERDKVLNDISEGSELEAVVKNITDYGAFMDCGVFDGLLHITDISWEKIAHPSEVLSIGQKLKVLVTKFNPETKRVSLGLKQLKDNPWQGLIDKYKVGDKFKGSVTSVADYGAFVELEPGVEGLVYQTEIAYNVRNLNPRKLIKVGEEVEVMVLDVDLDKQRISLSVKKCLENPWEKFAEAYPIGSKVKCSVKNLADFGIFTEVATGEDSKIEGLIPAVELTWGNDFESELKKYKPGDEIEALVSSIDQGKERITLSIRQLTEDYVGNAAVKLAEEESVMCVVTVVKKEGIEVAINDDKNLIAFIRKPELSKHKSEQRPGRFAIGEKVEAKFIGFDSHSRRLNVSIKTLEIEHEKEVIAKYGSVDSGASLGGILGDALGVNKKSDSSEEKKEEKPAKKPAKKAAAKKSDKAEDKPKKEAKAKEEKSEKKAEPKAEKADAKEADSKKEEK